MKCNPAIFYVLAVGLITIFKLSFAAAETAELKIATQGNGVAGTGMHRPQVDVRLETSYTAAGKVTFSGTEYRDSDAYDVSLGIRTRTRLNEHWSIPLELRSQNIFLGSIAGVPVPEEINTIQLGTGLSYRPNNRWVFTALVSPPIYRVSDIGGNVFGITGGLTSMWNHSPTFKIMFGVFISPDSNLKVLPITGVDWAINDQFNLRLIFPRPRMVYKPNDRWSFHMGADINMVTFRTDDSLGTSMGLPQYNDELGTYRDIKVGTGVGYRIGKTLSIEASAGYSVNRRIEYTDIDEQVEFDPAPYTTLNMRLGF